jgi:hypothetical protein
MFSSSTAKRTKKMVDLSAEEFAALGGMIMNREATSGSKEKYKKRWSSQFACDPAVISHAWSLIGQEQELTEPQHILWAMLLLSQYSSDTDLAGKCEGVHEDTF